VDPKVQDPNPDPLEKKNRAAYGPGMLAPRRARRTSGQRTPRSAYEFSIKKIPTAAAPAFATLAAPP
jgi:hypothetical protein